VTGLGLATPLGFSATEVLNRITAGETAARAPSTFDAGPFACQRCAEIAGFTGEQYVPDPKVIRLMNRDALLAVAAARLAMRDARLEVGVACQPEEVALFGATGVAGIPFEEISPLLRFSTNARGGFDMQQFGAVAMRRIRPVLTFKILSNMPICFVSIFEKVQGPNAVYTPWEGQGAQAIAAGIRAVARGQSRYALVGGCDVKTHELAFITLQQQGVFDSWREQGKGCVPGEGAAFLVLEQEQHARMRGARIYGRMVTWAGRTLNCSQPRHECYARLLGTLDPRQVTAIVSAADGNPDGQAAEYEATAEAGFAAGSVLCPKRHLGNLFAAAAAVQVGLAAAILAGCQPGERVLANCFGHGSEQAAFVLEAA
jgi:3-oxoacyl-[acyl-carrier-protein] synthase II